MPKGEDQLAALLKNLPQRWVGITLQVLIFPFGKQQAAPSDALQKQVALILQTPNASRARLCRGIDQNSDLNNPFHLLQTTLSEVVALEAVEKRLHQAIREKRVSGWNYDEHIQAAADLGLITLDEAQSLTRLQVLRKRVIAVDDFAADFS